MVPYTAVVKLCGVAVIADCLCAAHVAVGLVLVAAMRMCGAAVAEEVRYGKLVAVALSGLVGFAVASFGLPAVNPGMAAVAMMNFDRAADADKEAAGEAM
mmetsp:Transcript_94359/g.167768  ORF Transcript_94359/g.167768 Transcript_94359/m.167768 type:complete len:100 (+) Transcript_94359:581-880(+)